MHTDSQRTTASFVRHALGEAEPDDRAQRNVVLAHGKASLNATYNNLRMPGRPRAIAEDAGNHRVTRGRPHPETIVHSWLTGRKKGPLADFVVGTIDQILFASLRSRHLSLRHLGLARQVVIIDEAHAFDAYMSAYLDRSLMWLGAHGVPVVLLSATLPRTTRENLVTAYLGGAESARRRGRRRQGRWDSPADAESSPADQQSASTYPAITWTASGDARTRAVKPSGRSLEVAIETADDDLPALEKLLVDALVDGGCVAVVRNTVRRAQEATEFLRNRFGDDVHLAHSRFIGHDRMTNDEWLRERFGPPGSTATRPARAIVVATQVVEQSLDVDFDLLVTDLAPVDLLLQRIGRMHRHSRGVNEQDRPAQLRRARCVVVGVKDRSAAPPLLDSGGTSVYGKHQLWRAAALVDEITAGPGEIRLPQDISALVQRAYGPTSLGPETWQSAMAEAHRVDEEKIAGKRSSANTFRVDEPRQAGTPIVGWLERHIGEADDTPAGRAEVRDGDDSLEVILLLRSADGVLRIPDWVDTHGGRTVPINEPVSWELARVIAGCSIRLPAHVSHGADGDALIRALEVNWNAEFQSNPLLAGELILELDDSHTGTYGPYTLSYDPRTGLGVS